MCKKYEEFQEKNPIYAKTHKVFCDDPEGDYGMATIITTVNGARMIKRLLEQHEEDLEPWGVALWVKLKKAFDEGVK